MEAAIPVLFHLLKGETPEREVRSMAYQLNQMFSILNTAAVSARVRRQAFASLVKSMP